MEREMRKEHLMDRSTRTMRSTGAWSIALGIITTTVGLSVGIGCCVIGGKLLKQAKRNPR